MQMIIDAAGSIACLYDEAIDLAAMGRLTITRASHVEPDENGQWLADLGPAGGPVLRPFERRSQALEAEPEWLENHRLDSWTFGQR